MNGMKMMEAAELNLTLDDTGKDMSARSAHTRKIATRACKTPVGANPHQVKRAARAMLDLVEPCGPSFVHTKKLLESPRRRCTTLHRQCA